ncbi:TPA: hypothetical protein ACH3X1_008651 [Trebouxia sp. C0004]
MQTASWTRTTGLVSISRISVNRNVFQKSLAPAALRQRSTSTINAEANNTGASKGGSITNSGKTAQPDSYQRIEAPVRNNDSADKGYAYDGKDISDRQNDIDRLLVDQDQPEEQTLPWDCGSISRCSEIQGCSTRDCQQQVSHAWCCCSTGSRVHNQQECV